LVGLLAFWQLILGQRTEQIEIVNAEALVSAQKDGKEAQMLVGDVQFKHQNALMYCDSAYMYRDINSIEAFGSVRINQGDTLNLYGDHLFYDGNSQIATVDGKEVKLVSNEFTLTTDRLIYNRANNIASYFTGGVIESKSDSNRLTSIRGYYMSTAKMFDFKDSVVLSNPEFVMRSDTLKYFTNNKVVNFLGPTTITGDSNLIYCEVGWYKTIEDQSKYFNNAYLISDNRILSGDTLFYDRKLGYGQAEGNVEILDTLEEMLIIGDYAQMYELKDSAIVSREPLMIKIMENDSIFLHADTFKVFERDSIKYMLAYYGVRIFKSDLQAVCDSVSYVLSDSTIKLLGNPIMWSEENEMSADSVDLYIKNQELHSLYMRPNSFMVSQVDSIRYNQVKGTEMRGFFKDRELSLIKVKGNGQTIYFALDEEDRFIGVNRAESSDIDIRLAEQEIQHITFISDVESSMYPMGELDPRSELRFKGFQWRVERRPMSKEDLFRK
jgi:lipopolysaccharide export system protein LptA